MKTPPELRRTQDRLHALAKRVTGLLYAIDQLGSLGKLTHDERRAVLDAESFLIAARTRLDVHASIVFNAWQTGRLSAGVAAARLDAVLAEVNVELEGLAALPMLEPLRH